MAGVRGEAFLDLDRGLVVMSQHAKRLGYDAVVLFLDELILWLATRAGDVDFVSNEGSKLSKLVEAQRSERPIPIISFVARQRDLRELIGEHHAGALEVRFLDTLKHWEARFDKVKLEDRNLPVIVEKRLLAPVSEAARQEIDAEFDRVMRQRRQVLDTLLGSDGEHDMFRKVYPFSPALVQALIAASSVLQRERTALKLMLTLLVKKRDELAARQPDPGRRPLGRDRHRRPALLGRDAHPVRQRQEALEPEAAAAAGAGARRHVAGPAGRQGRAAGQAPVRERRPTAEDAAARGPRSRSARPSARSPRRVWPR